MDELAEIRDLSARGELERARSLFRTGAEKRVQMRGGHREWGLVAEELGLLGLAEREFNLALRDDPADLEALQRLVDLAEEKGAVERAINLLSRLFDLNPSAENALRLYTLYQEIGAEPKASQLAEKCRSLQIPLPRVQKLPEPEESQEPVIPPDADLVRFLSLFGGREDVYARQWFSPSKGEGGYSPVRQPLTPRELRAHLLGEVTLGVYPIRLDGTCLFAALDVDIQKSALEEARRSQALASLLKEELKGLTEKIRQRLEEVGLKPVVEDSGYKGRHFWFPLAAPEPAGTLVALGKAVVSLVQPLLGEHFACEWFPKASRPGTKGLGNLIKLPLGIHRRTGRRSCFLDAEGAPIKKPFEYLRSVPLLTRDVIIAVLDHHRLTAQQAPPEVFEAEESSATEKPVSLTPAPAWTAHDFDNSPVFRDLLGGCAVLRALTNQAIEERRLSYDEAIIIAHTFGHLPSGVSAANYLFSLAGTVPQHLRLKSPLRGNPISCVKIRARIAAVTSRLPCNCVFPNAQDLYPTPLLHVKPGTQDTDASIQGIGELEALVRRYLALEARLSALRGDSAQLRRAIIERMRLEPQPFVQVAGVNVRVETRDGVDHLIIENGEVEAKGHDE